MNWWDRSVCAPSKKPNKKRDNKTSNVSNVVASKADNNVAVDNKVADRTEDCKVVVSKAALEQLQIRLDVAQEKAS